MDSASVRASNVRYALVLSLLSGLPFLQHASFASAAVDADEALGLCQVETMPKDIRATLERRFYGWKVQDATSLVPKARQKWASIAPLACPGIAAGHFEDSRSVAYGLLLVPVDRSANGYKFVVFSAPSGQSYYGFKVLDQNSINASALFIHAVAIDRVLDSDLRKKLRTKGSDGILLVVSDDKTITQNVFFWTGDSYDHAQVDF
ncbi:MAG: hypothetical protein ACJ8R9_03260 [Steroidobacteraceae bacterium]